jgi:pimeloyl-ACP methyl ester carboxylesterase
MSTTTIPQVRFRTIDGVRIRYADNGSSTGKPTVILTSPWPESIYAFAPMWATLPQPARLFAIDLPGFGASERREDLLSPQAMGEFLDQRLPTSRLVIIDAGHFGWEEKPSQYASAVLDSITGNWP